MMKPFHPTDESTTLCKSGFMNPPHSAKLDKEIQTGDSTYMYYQLRDLLRLQGAMSKRYFREHHGEKEKGWEWFPRGGDS